MLYFIVFSLGYKIKYYFCLVKQLKDVYHEKSNFISRFAPYRGGL